jgi:hypothetical protein
MGSSITVFEVSKLKTGASPYFYEKKLLKMV